MVELGWALGDEDLGIQPCDGLICASPSGSTAYNLSNGGPVLVWGLEAMVLTFIAPHSLSARPLVAPPGADLIVWNRTADVPVSVIADGHVVGELAPAARAVVRLGPQRSLLGSLPESTFFARYRKAFGR
jgi:NAD+ kinase